MSVCGSAQALLGGSAREGILAASVYRVDPNKGLSYVADTTVPLVDYASEAVEPLPGMADLSEGGYLIQLTRPDGGIDTRQFQVLAGQQTEIRFYIKHEGPQEFTAFEAMQGNSLASRSLTASDGSMELSDAFVPDYFQLRDQAQWGYALSWLQNCPALAATDAIGRLASWIADDIWVEDAAQRLNDPGPLQSATIENNGYVKFEFVYQGLLGSGANSDFYSFGPGTDLQRHYLLQKSSRAATLICLPTPWMTEQEEVAISLLMDTRSVAEGVLDYSVTVADPGINTILGYINAGAIHQATRLIPIDKARDMLFSKVSRPLESVIGGYLLLFGQDMDLYRSNSDKWQDWTENLDHWFEWLPDGAIINAARFFRLRTGNEAESYEALMRAYARGLPYFTFGLKLLLEGMRYFVREGDAQAAECLQKLQALAMRSDPSKPFLAIDVARRWASGPAA